MYRHGIELGSRGPSAGPRLHLRVRSRSRNALRQLDPGTL